MKQHDFIIKYVYPDWFKEENKDTEVGFNSKYRHVDFPIGGKLLIYVIEYKIIVGAYHIVGKFFEDTTKTQHPLRLPLRRIYRIEDEEPAIHYNQIRNVVPNFKPDELISYWDITEEQYHRLENMLTPTQTSQ